MLNRATVPQWQRVLDNTICRLLEAGYFPSARLLKGAGFLFGNRKIALRLEFIWD
jgi:hypothetical protein